MSLLHRAIKGLAPRGDRAAIGLVEGLAGPGRYRVTVAGTEYEVPAAGGASAFPGQRVAVLISAETGWPLAMLGPVSL